MPSTRRSTGRGGAASKSKAKSKAKSTSQQSTIAFHGGSNQVSKPVGTFVTEDGKKRSSDVNLKDVTPVTVEAEPEAEAQELESGESTLVEITVPEAVLSPEEEQASRIKEKQIKEYWQKKEDDRIAPRVHQQGLTLHEKLLREWDTDGRYGPNMGISRMKRWKRANSLGLNPPIEILAVLMKELDADNKKIQRSHMEELMASSLAGVET